MAKKAYDIKFEMTITNPSILPRRFALFVVDVHEPTGEVLLDGRSNTVTLKPRASVVATVEFTVESEPGLDQITIDTYMAYGPILRKQDTAYLEVNKT